MKTIVIPAAGLGSRLSTFTKNYSKAMCTLGEKPVISYIIDKFSDEEMKQLFDECNLDLNGTLVYQDFINFWKKK